MQTAVGVSLFLVLGGGCVMRAETSLRSPWDTVPVRPTHVPYTCPAPAPLPQSIQATSYYTDAQHSVIDPVKKQAYTEASQPFERTMTSAVNAADAYRKTGSTAAAQCVLTVLTTAAGTHAMLGEMSSNQAHYVQGWTLGSLAIAWLKVRSAQPGTEDQRHAAMRWLLAVARQTQDYFSSRHAKGTNDGTNNHYYWAGMAVAAAGIANDDRGLYKWGLGTFDEAVSRVAADGTLPLEMSRGQRALHYHVFALAPIILLAELGNANGDDLYAHNSKAVQRLGERTITGLRDNSGFAALAGAPQDTPAPSGLKSTDVVWLVPYLKLFPNPAGSALLAAIPITPFLYLGGYPPGWAY